MLLAKRWYNSPTSLSEFDCSLKLTYKWGKKQIKKGNRKNLEVLKPIESWNIAADLSLFSTAPIFDVGKIKIGTSKADSALCAGTLKEL